MKLEQVFIRILAVFIVLTGVAFGVSFFLGGNETLTMFIFILFLSAIFVNAITHAQEKEDVK